jgi:hypothetical protein
MTPYERCKKYYLTHPWVQKFSAIKQRCNNPKQYGYKWYYKYPGD